MNTSNFYACSGMDRQSETRKDGNKISELLLSETTRVLPIWKTKIFHEDNHCVFLPATDLPLLNNASPLCDSTPIFLGVHQDSAWFAVDISGWEAPELHPPFTAHHGAFVDLRAVAPQMPNFEASLCAQARAMTIWHSRNRFCSVCGNQTSVAEAGYVLRCSNANCGASHFPRTDPVVIMLVHDGERCLLGRQAHFAPGMFSIMAGFVEPGESLEDAVAREVWEETGVQVTDIRYHSSQPWPFPSMLMLGFSARATTSLIDTSGNELEEARWFSRDWLRQTPESDAFRLPRGDAISRRIINDWINGVI
ncbi:NAD+ diphosphatase [Azospirillaceae bacterium]